MANEQLLASLLGGVTGLGGQQASQPAQARSGFGNFLFGSPSGFQQAPRFDESQLQGLMQLLQQGLSGIDPQAIQQQATSQFHQQTVPSLAERFTSMGAGRTSSPAFASQLGSAGAQLQEGLASQRAQQGLQMTQLGLQPKFETAFQQREPGIIEQLLMALAASAGKAAGGGK